MLPTYVIAGTVRSGTTSLHRWLAAHPDVFAPGAKELHFFDRHHDRGVGWYESHFAGASPGLPAGEATPNYVYDAAAVARMRDTLPKAQVLVLLRDPVERAYSQYWMQRSAQHEDLDFAAAVAAEPERLAGGDPQARAYYSYVDRGRYLQQLMHLHDHYPADQVKVVLYEDLRDRAEETFRTVCHFVGADPDRRPDRVGERANQHREYRSTRIRHLTHDLRRRGGAGRVAAHLVAKVNSRPVRYPPMDPAVRRTLTALYREPNAELAAWLGRDLHEWSPTGIVE